jgi:hypothetical protein
VVIVVSLVFVGLFEFTMPFPATGMSGLTIGACVLPGIGITSCANTGASGVIITKKANRQAVSLYKQDRLFL